MSAGIIAAHYAAAPAGNSFATEMALHSWTFWWRLGEASGTTAEDASANNLDGTISGSPTMGTTGLVSGDANTAITFDGTNDFINTPDGNHLDGADWTVLIAMKKSGAPGASQHLISRSNSGTAGRRHWFVSVETTGKARLAGYNTSGTSAVVDGATTVTDNTPRLICATCASGALSLYVSSGTADATGSISGTPMTDPAGENLTVGRRSSGGSFFAGILDEPAYLAGTALSAVQVGALMTAFASGITP